MYAIGRKGERNGALSGELVALTATVLFSLPALFSTSALMSALMVTAIALTALIYGGTASRPLYGEPIAILAVLWFLAAGLPVLAPQLYGADWYRPSVSPEILDLSALWLYRAWAAIAVGYWIARSRTRKIAPQAFSIRATSDRRTFENTLGGLGIVGLILTIIMSRGSVSVFTQNFDESTSSLEQLASYMRTCGLTYLFLAAARPGSIANNFTGNWLALATLLGQVGFGAASGAKGAFFAVAASIALGLAMRDRTRSRPLLDVALCILGIAGIYGISVAVTAYRLHFQSIAPPEATGLVDAILLNASSFWEAAYLGFTGQIPANPDLLARFSHLTGFGMVLQLSGEVSPHQGIVGTFLLPLYAVLPRDLIPFKEVFFNSGSMASIMGWSYGGLSVTLPGSIYWSLGYIAIVPVCAALGWLLARLHTAAVSGRSPMIPSVLFLPLLLGLMDVGAEFHSLIINSIRFLIIGLVISWWVKILRAPHKQSSLRR
jgi:hypothetical protein